MTAGSEAGHDWHDRLLRPVGPGPAHGRRNAGGVLGAAGAVGQTVGQVAKLKGCRVVGIAGTLTKLFTNENFGKLALRVS